MNKLVFLALAGALALSANLASADDHDFRKNHNCHFENDSSMPGGFENSTKIDSIAAVKDKATDDQVVFLKGRLTKHLGGEKFEFTDTAGDTIVVKLDDDYDWSHVSKDMPIEIEAEVDEDFIKLHLDVKCARPAGQMAPASGAPGGFNK